MSALERPLDEQNTDRIRQETAAVLALLQRFYAGECVLIKSPAHIAEADATSDEQRRADIHVLLDPLITRRFDAQKIEERAQRLCSHGFKPMDASHLAHAEAAHVDYFVTTDDRLLKRAKRQSDLPFEPLNPLEVLTRWPK